VFDLCSGNCQTPFALLTSVTMTMTACTLPSFGIGCQDWIRTSTRDAPDRESVAGTLPVESTQIISDSTISLR
jgi:hypothetical protein